MTIITKFTVATDQGMDALSMLTKETAVQKFSSLLEKRVFDNYLTEHFNRRTLMDEVNSMSNQWLIVYVDNNPAGYARITSRGKKPRILEGKRSIRIADFGILDKYQEPEVINALLEKCLAVCRPYENIWINEYAGDPMIETFENNGFRKLQEAELHDELPLASLYLIK